MAPMSFDWWTLTRPAIFVRSAIAESTTFTLSSTASTFWIASRSRFAPASFSSDERCQGLGLLLIYGHGACLLSSR